METQVISYEPYERCEDWCENCTLVFVVDHITDIDQISDQIARRVCDACDGYADIDNDNPDAAIVFDAEEMLRAEISEVLETEDIKFLENEQYDPELSWKQPCVMATYCECCGALDIMIGDYKDAAKEVWPDEMKEEWEQHCTPILKPNHDTGELLAELFHGVDNIYEAEPNYNPYIEWDDPVYLDDPDYRKHIENKKRAL